MRADRLKSLRAAAALAATAILGLLTFGPVQSAQATSYVAIVGAGSTYAYPALDQWGADMTLDGLDITYTPNGSAAGREGYASQQYDFAGSDIAYLTSPDPFAGTDNSSFAYSYVPDVAGGLSFLYNIQVDGQKITNMRLSGETLAKIFTGQITNWDNPEIEHEYGAPLPSIPITVVTRSDGAGESYFLTNWMLDEYPSIWVPYCEEQGGGSLCQKDPTEFYPAQHAGFRSLDGANEVAGYINSSANNGAIGYAEEAYAIPDHIPVVSVENAAGYYQQPTAANVAVSLHSARINEDESSVNYLMQDLTYVYSDKDPRTYPLSSYSYLVVPRNSRPGYEPDSFFSNPKGVTLSTFINYILCPAQQTAQSLGYSPLPDIMVEGGFLQESKIPGAVVTPAAQHYNDCHNPAYYDGKDIILDSAPQPSPCQKVGTPLNCVVNKEGKPVPGGPGNNNNGNNNNGGGTNHGGGTNGGGTNHGNGTNNGSNGSINPNTGQVNDPGGTSSANPDVYAQTVGLASRPTEQWLFGVLTALELIGVVAVPVLLGLWLQRARRGRRAAPDPGGGPRGGDASGPERRRALT
jgi:ABC-type phosphate transport system substrate-binding protein